MTTTASTSHATAANDFIRSLQQTNSKEDSSVTKLMTDEETRFLKLLTTQLQNQDPMNPMDNAQMTSQMAQISTVKGIEKMNLTLQKLIDSTSDAQWMQAANMVGRQVMASGSGLNLAYANDGGHARGGIELAGPADQITIRIRDANGLPIRTMELGGAGKGIKEFSWDGLNDEGEAVMAGRYNFSVSAIRAGENVTAKALQLTEVSGVLRDGSKLLLETAALGRIAMADIKLIG